MRAAAGYDGICEISSPGARSGSAAAIASREQLGINVAKRGIEAVGQAFHHDAEQASEQGS